MRRLHQLRGCSVSIHEDNKLILRDATPQPGLRRLRKRQYARGPRDEDRIRVSTITQE